MKNYTFTPCRFTRKLVWVSFILCVLCSCEDQADKHYEVPEWVKGSAWEILSDESREGRYSTFLEAAELAGYRNDMKGRGIMTVMAPDNEAFAAYLNEKGYASVQEMARTDMDALQQLVGFHLLHYAFNKNELENFRPEGEGAYSEGTEILDPGMYYKFRTRSAADPTEEVIDVTKNKKGYVYHLDRFVPVFSHYFFSSKRIDAKANYEYFYPNSTWTGAAGFNVSEASVEEYSLLANNGYVYLIDRVLDPPGTLYDELKSNDNYSEFLAMYDKFSTYTYDEDLSTDFGGSYGVDSLYLHAHRSPLPSIAMEWYKYDYRRLDTLAYKAYSVFAPSNTALNTFFDSYWQGSEYGSYDELDPLINQLFLNEYVYSGSVVFPEEITKGTVVNGSGMAYNFDPYSLTHRKMCVNGSFYGLNQIETPLLFGSVAGPAFQRKELLYFLYAMNRAGLLSSFGSATNRYTLLIPANEAFENTGITLNTYPEGNVLQEESPDSESGWASVASSRLQDIVRAHTVIGEAVELNTTGTQVVPIQTSFNYWFVKDGKITSSNHFNSLLNPEYAGDPFVAFKEVKNNNSTWSNGRSYTYDGTEGLFETATEDDPTMQSLLATNADTGYPYYLFAQLLKKAGMVSGEKITGLSGRAYFFIPTNDALKTGLENREIPGAENLTVGADGTISADDATDKTALQKYLSNYIMVASAIVSAPYPGSQMKSGEYLSYSSNTLVYTDNGTSLSIGIKGKESIPLSDKYHYFPFCYNDGCIQFIESLLKL